MKFDIIKSIEILVRTPFVLSTLLSNISEDWLFQNEGENTWSPYDVLGHLIHGEKTDWMPRVKLILSDEESKVFQPFDRFAQMDQIEQKSIQDLLFEFKNLRQANLDTLKTYPLHQKNLSKTGTHPDLGEANLQQLLATWVVHDLGHISQITRVMAKQYSTEVGPWKAYLGILK